MVSKCIELLTSVLYLEPADSEDAINLLKDICTPSEESKTGDISQYNIEFGLLTSFTNISPIEQNFVFTDITQWEKLLSLQSTDVEYAAALEIILKLASISILNRQSLAQKPAIKAFVKNRLKDDHLEPHLVRAFEELYYQIFSVQADSEEMRYVYEEQYPYRWNLLSLISEHLNNQWAQTHLIFKNAYVTFTDQKLPDKFTIETNIELLGVTSNRILTLGRDFYIGIENEYLCISDDSYTLAVFSEYDFREGIVYKLAIRYDLGSVSLFVNGDFVQSITLHKHKINNVSVVEIGSVISYFKLYQFSIIDDCLRVQDDENDRNKYHLTDKLKRRSLILNVDIDEIINTSSKDTKAFELAEISNSFSTGKCFYYQTSDIVGLFESMNILETLIHRLLREDNLDIMILIVNHLIKCLKNTEIESIFLKFNGYSVLNYILMAKTQEGYNIPFSFLYEDDRITRLLSDIYNADNFLTYESPLKIELNFRLTAPSRHLISVFDGLNEVERDSKLSRDNILALQRTIIFQLYSFFSQSELSSTLESNNSSVNVLLECFLIKNIHENGTIVHLQFPYFCLVTGNIVLAKLLLQTLESTFSYYQEKDQDFLCKDIPRTLYIKVFLILLEAGIEHVDVIETVYAVLLKFFENQSLIFEQFMDTNGYTLLLGILSTYQKSTLQLIACILKASNRDQTNSLVIGTRKINYPSEDRLSIFSHCLIINVLEHFISKDPFDIQDTVVAFIDYLNDIREETPDHMIFHGSNYRLVNQLMELQISLEMTNAEDLLLSVGSKNKSLLAEIIVHLMTNMDYKSFESLLRVLANDVNGKKAGGSTKYRRMGFIFMVSPEIFKTLLKFTSKMDIGMDALLSFGKKLIILLSTCSVYWRVHDASWDSIFDLHRIVAITKEHIVTSHLNNVYAQKLLKNLNEAHEEIDNWLFAFAVNNLECLDNKLLEEFLHSLLYYQEVLFIERHRKTAFSNETVANLLGFLKVTIPSFQPNLHFLGLTIFRAVCTLRFSDLELISKLSSKKVTQCCNFLNECMKEDDEKLLSNLQLSENSVLFEKSINRLRYLFQGSAMATNGSRRSSRSQFIHVVFKEKTDHYKWDVKELSSIHSLFKKDNLNLTKNMFFIEDKRLQDFFADLKYQDDLGYHLTLKLIRKSSAVSYLRNFPVHRKWFVSERENVKRQRKQLLPIFEPDQNIPTLDGKYCLQQEENVRSQFSDISNTFSSSEDLGSDFKKEGIKDVILDKNRAVLQLLKSSENITNIWNTTKIMGLSITPGVIVLTTASIYFIPGCYYHLEEKKVMDIATFPGPLKNSIVDAISSDLLLKPSHSNSENISLNSEWDIHTLYYVIKRPFLLRDTAMELFFGYKSTVMFSFESQQLRNEVFLVLRKIASKDSGYSIWSSILEEVNFKSNVLGRNNGITHTSVSDKLTNALTILSKQHVPTSMIDLWNEGLLSNFDYIMAINTLAGRTCNDLTQYPVFPWVIADYESDEINLDDPATYRDLSKPMGAQNEQRKQAFIERFEALKGLDDESPPFHYGTHYSSAMIVSSYLVRLEPFSSTYKTLQGGQWGPPDRLFNSISRAWKSASSEASTDVRELIPEFFYLPDFLENKNGYEFGVTQTGHEVSNVSLPPWAKNDPKKFIEINRQALESKYVSEHLHEWIDLIFGFKQRGSPAVEAVNVFNALSYPGNVDIDKIDNENERKAITGIIYNFGQTPLQIFQNPHPQRKVKSHSSDIDKGLLEVSTASPYTEDTKKAKLSVLKIHHKGFKINGKVFRQGHSSPINVLKTIDDKLFATGDQIGLIKVWRIEDDRLNSMTSLSGHETGIKAIESSLQYDLLFSLDADGVAITWDLTEGRVINKFPTPARLISLSPSTGNLAIVGDKGISVYDINASLYCLCDISDQITAIKFIEHDMFWPYRFHEQVDTILVAMTHKIVVYSLKLVGSEWQLLPVETLESSKVDHITDINIKTGNSLANTEGKANKVELVTTDKNGNRWLWT
ncbi:beige protein homolog 1 [Kluyveromyces marxianus DMKU3-1042]|uniref:Beige protein homolog 1 n=1 Tax=Kluyveromyces marxianus (strain DMKU3-1042 / BCC 29191 / NBRC 104275) TaxID=1003335 RepID=W0TBY8_KLUMD|nr:uncharacterized protein KLMA_50266 [Kluyveromyces marxianus DMKU3-1042]BAO40920.1 beige protein homolog 1 [Kluyveromyces marxianus DMKU3-1042]